jgi:ABC-type multidrug transport system fused ATPase/permease subunit
MESGFINLLQIPFTVIFFAAYLIKLNAFLFLVCFIPVPILAAIGASFATPFKYGSKKYMSYLGKVNNIVNDMVGGISLVKSYNLEHTLMKKYSSGIEKATKMASHNDIYQYKGAFVFSMIRNITAITCLVVGGYMCVNGNMTVGALVSFSTLLSKMVSPFINASSIFFQAKQAAASAERLLSIVLSPKERSGTATEGIDCRNIIEFENVCFEYENGAHVLKGLSFTAEKGKTTAFAGQSGCGKSTVFNLICGFYHNSGGKIYFMGRDINDWDINEMRSNISYVSQTSFLFPVSIYENIRMGKKDATKEEVYEAAKAANAHDFILDMADGYDTIVGERGCRLSGGQIQRIAIARAILKNAPILLLDEATSALDIKSEYLVQQAINRLSLNKTVIIIAHRLSTIRDADKIIIIDEGRMSEQGTHNELIKSDGIYAALYNADKEAV